MNPMSIRDAANSSPRESFSTSEPLSVVGVCLDEETWTVLKGFAESAPNESAKRGEEDADEDENAEPEQDPVQVRRL